MHGPMHAGSEGSMKWHAGMHTSPGASKAPFDHQFLDTMSAHYHIGMEMAQMAESKSSRGEIKGLAKMMHEDQEKILHTCKSSNNNGTGVKAMLSICRYLA